MCGVAGIISKNKNFFTQNKINKFLKIMRFRGPDSNGHVLIKNKNYNINLFHSRLKIIDPNINASQPMEDSEGIIIFNGMIYNFMEIKKKFFNNEIFKTNSDTEVLLKFVNKFGHSKLHLLDGMWAFAYFNKRTKTFFLSRDRFGEKPLFFYKSKNTISFGSNVSYILNLNLKKKFSLNYAKFKSGFALGYRFLNNKNNNESYIKNIMQVPQGCCIEISPSLDLSRFNYWDPLSITLKKNSNFRKNSQQLKKDLLNSIKLRAISDFPQSTFVSSGVDSNAIVSIIKKKTKIKKINCISIDTNDTYYDESKIIKKNLNKLKIECSFVKPVKSNYINLRIIKSIIETSGDILPTSTWLMFAHLCKFAKKKKIKVVNTGLGADEFFAGYYSHHIHYLKSIKSEKSFSKNFKNWELKVQPTLRNESLSNYKNFLEFSKKKDGYQIESLKLKKYFRSYPLKKIAQKKFYKDYFKNILANEIFIFSLPTMLAATDTVSMYFNIEARSPFLNQKFYETSFLSPNSFLIRNGYNKAILREALKKIVSKEILLNREKIGFFTGLDNFFNLRNKKLINMITKDTYIKKIIKINELKKIFLQKKISNQESHLIFMIMNFIIYKKTFKKFLHA